MKKYKEKKEIVKEGANGEDIFGPEMYEGWPDRRKLMQLKVLDDAISYQNRLVCEDPEYTKCLRNEMSLVLTTVWPPQLEDDSQGDEQ